MPETLIRKMKAGYRGKGLSKEEVDHRVYGYLNKKGLLHDVVGRARRKKHLSGR